MTKVAVRPNVRARDLAGDVWRIVAPFRARLASGLVWLFVNRASALVLPLSTKFFLDDVLAERRSDMLLPLIAAIVAATGVQCLTTVGVTRTLARASESLVARMRAQIQWHVLRLGLTFHDLHQAGNLSARIMRDVEGLRIFAGTGLTTMFGSVLGATFAIVVMSTLSPLLTLVAVTVLSVSAFAMSRAFGRHRPIFRERSIVQAEVTGRLTEVLGGVRVVKGFAAEPREAARFATGVERLRENALATVRLTTTLRVVALVLVSLTVALVMVLGAREVFAGALTTGELVTFTVFLGLLVAPAFETVGIAAQISEAIAGLERTREILAETPEDEDPLRTSTLVGVRGEIECERVSFGYVPGVPVLHDISFRAVPGTVTAIVGASGSGKSTLAQIIAAFREPSAGRVLVDGHDLRTIRLRDYRSQLGIVLQDPLLFDGTIRENVLFGRADASEEALADACRLTGVDELARELADGYETRVGERGVCLSGGERQRISIARAILADPRILILDEATSSLDHRSEAWVQRGLQSLFAGRTTFVIAHRLSTVRSADTILVLNRGRIVERGSHAELYAAGGEYREMVSRQALGLIETHS